MSVVVCAFPAVAFAGATSMFVWCASPKCLTLDFEPALDYLCVFV